MFDWKTWLSATPILWKALNWLGDNPGVLLLVAGLAIAGVTMWKAPKAEAGDDKVDAAHPIVQVILRLISNGPRMLFSLLAVLAFVLGTLDLTGTVPLRERRADLKIEKQQDTRPATLPARPKPADWRQSGNPD